MSSSKFIKCICFVLFCWAIILAVNTQVHNFLDLMHGGYGYQIFPISDWMINYEGGFVRRGLIGQILWTIYQCHPYPIVYAIACIYYVSYLVFSVLICRLLMHKGVSIFVLPFTICLFYGLGEYIIGFRRDYIVLAMTCCIFLCYNQYLSTQNKKFVFLIYGLSILVLLIHESTFFFTFPILILHTFFTAGRCNSIKKLFVLWSPAVITMGLVCIFKGNPQIPEMIWKSWMDCITNYPLNGDKGIGLGVAFLSNGLNVIGSHFVTVWGGYKLVILNLYGFVAIYYLVTRINTINLNWYPLKSIDRIFLSNILIIQLFCLTPMLGFLSCDFGRVMAYWTLSSLLFYCCLQNSRIQGIPYLSRLSKVVQDWIDKRKALNHPLVYLFVLVSMPLVPYTGSTFFGCFRCIASYDMLLSVWKSVRHLIS